MGVLRFLARYLWLWVLLLIAAAFVFFTITGNDPLLPAIYR
ncbi:MAG: hypothetical protein M5R36_03825 [Deltaproteobacteria bacterium]|nr:hypothetical protein [Deltaproteobacteria bacterium]